MANCGELLRIWGNFDFEKLAFFDQVPEDGDSAPEPMSFSPMTKLITKLYEDKVQADEVDDREGNRREALPEFIYSSLIHQYGLKTLAKEHLGQLVNGVRKHAKDDENFNPRVKLFGQLSGILNEDLFSSATANFMLDFLRRLFVSSMIEESMNHDGCAVTLEQATEAVTEAFNSYSTSVPPGLLEELEKMGKETTVAVEVRNLD